jgi:hypothetical protein
VVADLLRGLGYSLQANRKTLEGTNHPDRDGQFSCIRHERPTFRNFLLPVQTRPILGWSGCGTWAATMMRIVLSTVLNT